MASAKKRMVQDKEGTQFFPITHTEAVIDNDGDTVETRLGRKQDTLVSGTNIKTINNNSLLGSGNITISSGGQVTVDSELSSTSTNPVQNKVINSALNGKQDTISDLATIRSGAELGATALQSYIETDPTVPSWAKASNKPSYTASEVGAIASSLKGAVNGVAELDSSGLVPSSQLPSYVDDVLEYSAKSSFPTTGEAGKIYVDTATNLSYRWGGSAYVEISPSLGLGTTSSTAFRGDYGNTAYAHATNKGSAFTSGLYKITTNSEGHVTAATAVEKSDITALGIPSTNTTYGVVTGSENGLAPMFSTANKATSASTSSYYFLGLTGSTLKWYSLPANAFANTTYANGAGLSLSGTTFSLATSGVTAGTYYKTMVDAYGRVTEGSYATLSAAINGDLTEDTSSPTDADYYIAQYVGGGISTTSYHRRPHSALYGYIKDKLDSVYVPLTRTVNSKALSANITLTLDDIGNGSTRSLANYLPLTGGTLSNATFYPLTINNSTSGATSVGIQFNGAGTRLGNIYVTGSNNTLHFYYGDSDNIILHSGNYTSFVNTTNFPGLNGNQTITLSGDVSGSGATSISVSIGQEKVTNAMLAGSIDNGKLANSSITINGASTSLGGSFSTASITAGTAGQSTASSGVSFSIPYVTMNAYGIVTGYGTHTHTISAQNLYDTIGSTKYAPYNSNGYLPLSGGTMTGAITPASGQSSVSWACSTLTASEDATIAGNVGIGTTSPAYKLDVNGRSRFFGSDTRFYGLVGGSSIALNVDTSQYTGSWNSTIRMGADGTNVAVLAGLYSSGATPLYFWYGGASQDAAAIYILWSTKNVGIGTSSPSQKLHVAGNILATGTITPGSASDSRLKNNITSMSISHAKDIILNARPVSFTWNDIATSYFDGYKGDDFGLLAQDVESYIPQAIGTIFEKYKRLDYTKFITPLISVAQDHESRIQQLEQKLNIINN